MFDELRFHFHLSLNHLMVDCFYVDIQWMFFQWKIHSYFTVDFTLAAYRFTD